VVFEHRNIRARLWRVWTLSSRRSPCIRQLRIDSWQRSSIAAVANPRQPLEQAVGPASWMPPYWSQPAVGESFLQFVSSPMIPMNKRIAHLIQHSSEYRFWNSINSVEPDHTRLFSEQAPNCGIGAAEHPDDHFERIHPSVPHIIHTKIDVGHVHCGLSTTSLSPKQKSTRSMKHVSGSDTISQSLMNRCWPNSASPRKRSRVTGLRCEAYRVDRSGHGRYPISRQTHRDADSVRLASFRRIRRRRSQKAPTRNRVVATPNR
jgi:hypothetical protein